MARTRTWDAAGYDRVGAPMTAMAAAVLDRLRLRGDETVLDAGCGTGRVSELLLGRLPRGRVIAVDADPGMVATAAANLAGRADVRRADLLELTLDEPVDAVLSTATFHWILDHDTLFRRLAGVLRPGGRLVAQCGGAGNIAGLMAVAGEVAARPEHRAAFDGWSPPWNYAGPEETAARLEAAGFTDVRCWLEPWPVRPDDPVDYLRTVPLGPYVDRLGGGARADRFISEVAARLTAPVTVDYVRLNIDATRR